MMKENVLKNKGKVDARQQAELLKLDERILVCQNKAQELHIKEARLNSVVENLACRPVVEGDFIRAIGETEARMIRKKTTHDDADVVTLFKNDGFTVDKLMKDVRYRVQAALSSAGLQGTEYGK